MKSVFKDVVAETVYIYPLGDVHIGDKNCDMRRLDKYLEYLARDDGIPRFMIGLGDWLNVATRHSKSSPHQQSLTFDGQMDLAVEKLSPIADRILAMVIGNHEDRLVDHVGFDPMKHLCERLDIPYLGYSGVVALRVDAPKKKDSNTNRPGRVPQYIFYVHHCTGGGNTAGGKMNRVVKLADIFPDANIYLGGHTHGEGSTKGTAERWDMGKKKIFEQERLFVNTGAFLKYGGYAEAKQLSPTGIGAPRIELSGTKWMAQINHFIVEN